MTKSRTIKRWQFLCWEALSKWKRQSGICRRCGKTKLPKQLNAHHLVTKAHGNYAKFEPDNIVALCGFYCHMRWWHGNSTWDEQRDLIARWIGMDRYWEIKRESSLRAKYTEEDYKKMLILFTDNYYKGVVDEDFSSNTDSDF